MSNDIKKQLGKRVRNARKAKGLTQEQLAEIIDKTVETVSNIERGVKLPGIVTLGIICEALDMTYGELLD